MAKDLIIRSSTEEFITFKIQEKEKGIQVRYENETLWMTQKAMAELFDVGRPAITKHLNNIFKENELNKNSVCSILEHTAEDGKKYQIVSAFLDLAEDRAKRNIPMTMEDWATRIDKFLLADDRDILKDAGKISHEISCDKALTEFEKYRVKQDKLYKSDFDLLLEEAEKRKSENNE